MEDTPEDGLRANGESKPLGSQAAFCFAEGGSAGAMADEMRRAANFTSETVAAASPVKSSPHEKGSDKKRSRSTSPHDNDDPELAEDRAKLLKPSPEAKVAASPKPREDVHAETKDGERLPQTAAEDKARTEAPSCETKESSETKNVDTDNEEST